MLSLRPRQRRNQHGADWHNDLFQRPHYEEEASGIQANRSGTERPPNQKTVCTPGQLVHQTSCGNIRAETQQVPGLSAPGG